MLVRRTHVQIAVGEVAASAARDADLLGHLGRMIDQQHLQALLAGLGRAEQAGGTGADDDGVKNLEGDLWGGGHGGQGAEARTTKPVIVPDGRSLELDGLTKSRNARVVMPVQSPARCPVGICGKPLHVPWITSRIAPHEYTIPPA